MLVLFKQSPQSIIRAYMVGRLENAKPVEDTAKGKYFFDETVRADGLEYDPLYARFKERLGGLDFLEDDKLYEILEDEIFWASRYNSPDRFQLIFTVLGQIERTGTKAYLAQQSPEAKEMKDRIRRVSGEFRRAKGVLSFSEDQRTKAITARASFEHTILDLVLRHYAKRKPGYTVVLLDEENAHICLNDEILVEPRDKFPDRPGRKDSERYWTMLTDLRHLESKKDPKYLTEQLPRNYWKWVSEGVPTAGGVSSATLDDFQ
jgi:hypothetical protein